MRNNYAWTGELLRVDLNRGAISVEEWDQSWIGGKAFGALVMFNEEPTDCNDYDPRRILILSSGPLTGTLAPSSSRGNVSNRNATTGGISTSSIGGYFPAEMKFAGYDHILITGRAETPVYLYINNSEIKILDASHLWGKTAWETEYALREHYSDPNLRIACIGPAGENRVRFACIMGDRDRAASWGGNGALMGSKNLKAIAMRGTNPIYIANPSGFLDAAKEANKKIGKTMGAKLLRRGGTIGVISPELNPYATKNYHDDFWDPAKAELLTYKVFRQKHKGRPVGCFNCNIACGRFLVIDEGKYAGIMMDGAHINTVRGFGSNLDITAPDEIIKANAIANQYGLGVDGVSSVVGWVIDCFEKGLITEKDLGYRVKWGDIDSFITLAEDITFRRGLGDVLAEGIKRASQVIGRGSEEVAVLVKGSEVNEGRMRSHKAWALGIVTSPRGGGHLDGAPTMEGVGFSNELCRSIYGIPNANDATSYEHKAKFVVYTERLKMLVDSLGLCYFTSVWNDPNLLVPEDYARLYSEATGDEKSAEELLEIADRAINLEKAFNTLHAGFTREDDYPPHRLVNEPVKSLPFEGELLHKDKWTRMLNDYYELHGWDKTTGQQGLSQLKNIGLEFVADRLLKKGSVPY